LVVFLPVRDERRPLELGHRGFVAGVLDCDGSIWISNSANGKRRKYTLRVSVSNTRYPLVGWFADTFGGKVYEYAKRNDTCKNEYRWQVGGQSALPVLNAALPYLVIKREQALIALEFLSTVSTTKLPIPESFYLLRGELYERMRELNKRGPR
jgi:hypothetical protein